MAADNKKMNEIIGRLDHLILQQEDRPEVYTMQRVSRNISNIDITTTTMLKTMQDVFKTGEDTTKQQKTLFQRVIENFSQTSNKVRASILSLTDIIRTTLDFKGHLSRISNGIDEMRLTAKMQFARAQDGFNRWFEKLIFRVNDMKRIIGLQQTSADDLNSFLTNGSGSHAPLTVGFVSSLYKKIFAYQLITDIRARKTSKMWHKQNMTVQRNQAADLKRIADHLTGKKMGWIAKLFQIVGIGLMFLGGKITTLATSLAGAASAASKFGKLGRVASSVLLGFGKFTKGSGKLIEGLATNMGGTVKSMMMFVVKRLFLGIGKMVSLMLNPVALVAIIAGYGFYKLFEEELDRIFAALKNIFGDPEKRAMLFNVISQWFTDMITGIGEWFGLMGDNIKEAVPEDAVDGILGAFYKVKDFITSAFKMYVNAINKIVATWLSIPDSFQMLMMAIDGLMLGVKEFVVNALDALPDMLKSDGMKKFIADADIEGNRAKLDAQKSELQGRIDGRYNTDYVGDAGNAVVQGVKDIGQGIVDGTKSAVDLMKSPYDALATSTENLDKFLSAEIEKKKQAEDALAAAERKKMFEEGIIKPMQEVKRSAVLGAVAAQEAAARRLADVKESAGNVVSTSVNSVQNNTSFNKVLGVSGDAKMTSPSNRRTVN